MNNSIIGCILLHLALVATSLGVTEDISMDQLKEQCTRSDLNSRDEVKGLFATALKIDPDLQCISLLFQNKNLNTRGLALDALSLQDQEVQKRILSQILTVEDIWKAPQKIGEEIASHQTFVNQCASMIRKAGYQCEAGDLGESTSRLKLAKLISGK